MSWKPPKTGVIVIELALPKYGDDEAVERALAEFVRSKLHPEQFPGYRSTVVAVGPDAAALVRLAEAGLPVIEEAV